MLQQIEETFATIGGHFITPIEEIARRLKNIKAYVFDWDGVFNDSVKSNGHPNGFSEADSMGINLMRFEYYHRNNHLPLSAIVTGEENPTAVELARRENFTALYYKIKNKAEALEHFCNARDIQPLNVAFFFDDVLDLSIAKQCGMRFYLGRPSQPLTTQYVLDNALVDYISAHAGGQHGLRECCELSIALNGHFDHVLNARIGFTEEYAEYFTKRLAIKPVIFTKKETGIEEVVS